MNSPERDDWWWTEVGFPPVPGIRMDYWLMRELVADRKAAARLRADRREVRRLRELGE